MLVTVCIYRRITFSLSILAYLDAVHVPYYITLCFVDVLRSLACTDVGLHYEIIDSLPLLHAVVELEHRTVLLVFVVTLLTTALMLCTQLRDK